MSEESQAVIVEDLFLTDNFLVKGRVANKYQRLAKVLEDHGDSFVCVVEATMISLHGEEVIRTPSVLINPSELVFAHELVDVAGDERQRLLADHESNRSRVRAFYNGTAQLELAGSIEAGAYEPSHFGRRYFTMTETSIRGLDLEKHPDLAVLGTLGYLIIQKSKVAYVYDIG